MIANTPWRTLPSDKSKHYIDKDLLRAEVQKCIDNNRQCSNQLANSFNMIVENMLNSANFRGYGDDWKDEMRGFAHYKLMKSMKSVDLAKCKNIFNYYSRITWLAFITRIQQMKKEDHNKLEYIDNIDYSQQGKEYITT